MKQQMRAAVLGLCVVSGIALVDAQTKVTAPSNKYSIADDVKLGREAAQEVRQQMPMLPDDRVDGYVEEVGERLARNVPAEFQHREFDYTFDVVNLAEINAFALPGGPMFAHRGMLEKAGSEAEIAGVLAHEISHVALRHGTAQASKAGKYQLGQLGVAIFGAILGGRTGEAVSTGGQLLIGATFLKYSREYEKQADILGAQIMARSGYDPRAMATMFQRIEKESGGRAPEWLSNHPNPGNRASYITKEAQALRVTNPVTDTRDFQTVQSRLAQMSPAMTSEEAARRANTRNPGTAGGARPTGRVDAPSTRYNTYDEGGIFRVSVPSNWREMASENNVTFAPEGGYGAINNQSVFTHGVQIGLARNERHSLQEATDELLASLAESNRGMSRPSGYTRGTIGGRAALRANVSNNAETGRERLSIYTTQLQDGTLFYMIGVAPESEYDTYANVFQRIATSIRFTR